MPKATKNWCRLQRAIHILLRAGEITPASHHELAQPLSELPYDYRPFFIMRPRFEVLRTIDERVEHMVCFSYKPIDASCNCMLA